MNKSSQILRYSSCIDKKKNRIFQMTEEQVNEVFTREISYKLTEQIYKNVEENLNKFINKGIHYPPK